MDDTPRAQRPPDDGREPDCTPTLPAGPGEGGPLSRFTALRAGSLFAGRYVIRARLGGGGAGEVYAAFDRVAGQPVALKVLFPRGDDGPQPLARLQRELRIARRSRHDGIVRVHDIGESEGLLFLVMDLLEGETLRQRMARDGRLAPAEAVRILRGIFDALGALHAQGGIHRDVKPANVFLVGDVDSDARVVLLDFGLARAEDDLSMTRTGQFVGTPEYVSPEQARGEREIGPASDLYSAGIVLWEMLAGTPPFTGNSGVEILTAQIGRALPDPRRAMPGVPAWLRHLAAWLMEKEPARRPRDTRAAIEALDRGRAPLGAGISRWARSRRLRIAVAGVALGVPLALALFLPVRPRIDEQNRLAAASLAGLPLRPFDFDGARAVAALPWRADAYWPREQLVLLNAEANQMPPRFWSALARVDLLTGRVEPFDPPGLPGGERSTYPAFFPLYGSAFGGQQLLALPPSSAGEPRFAVSLKQDDYPAILAILSAQSTALMTPHAGWMWDLAIVPPFAAEPRSLLVAAAENNPLGQRLAVFAVPADDLPGAASVSLPPYELDLPSPREPVYYTFLSRGGSARVHPDGNRVRIEAPDGQAIVLDARTGEPVDAKERAGLSPEEWADRQRRLLALLLAVGRLRPDGDDAALGRAAADLEAFAAQHQLGTAQAGVALARAAELRMRLGDLDAALALIDQALALEPAVPGHYRLRIQLLARLGRWPDAEAFSRSAPSIVSTSDPVRFDLIVAGLASGHAVEAERLVAAVRSAPRPGSGYYDLLGPAVVDLAAGRGDAAATLLAQIVRVRELPDFAFYVAMADALRETPDVAGARAALAVARTGRGSGHVLPFEALAGYLAALEGRTPSSLPAIEAELARLRVAARERVLEWWLLPWGEAFAARGYQAAGDREGEERHAAAVSRPGGAAGAASALLLRQ